MLNRRTLSTLLACTLLVPLACDSGGSTPEPPKPPPAPKPTPEPMPPTPTPPAPTPAPEPSGGGDVASGNEQYQLFCASCHGAAGDGDGPVSAGLDPKPASHSDGTYMNPLSDEHLFLVIKNGGPAVGKSPLMAPWGSTLDDAQIRDVIAFIRSLADPPYPGS